MIRKFRDAVLRQALAVRRLDHKISQGLVTAEELEWFLGISHDERERLMRESIGKRISTTKNYEEFSLAMAVGTVSVLKMPNVEVMLSELKERYGDSPLFSSEITDTNFKSSQSLTIAGGEFMLCLYMVTSKTSSEHCMAFIKNQGGQFLGPYGLALAHSMLCDKMPKTSRLLSFAAPEDIKVDGAVHSKLPVMVCYENGSASLRLGSVRGVRSNGEYLCCFVPV
jgi:hypothetical protein